VAKKPLASRIRMQMTDLGNGTYTGDFTVEQSGEISILIVLMNANGVHADFFNNRLWQNPIAYHEISPNVNYDWGNGDVIPGVADYLTAHFYTYIKAPKTETYTLDIVSDDGSNIYFDTQAIGNKLGTYGANINQKCTVDMIGGQFYDLSIDYEEFIAYAKLKVWWSTSTIAKEIIPPSYFYYPTHIGSSPYQLAMICPDGFTGDDSINAFKCLEVCGDGIRIGSEL
jgi:hypothetical protein